MRASKGLIHNAQTHSLHTNSYSKTGKTTSPNLQISLSHPSVSSHLSLSSLQGKALHLSALVPFLCLRICSFFVKTDSLSCKITEANEWFWLPWNTWNCFLPTHKLQAKRETKFTIMLLWLGWKNFLSQCPQRQYSSYIPVSLCTWWKSDKWL